VQPSAADRFRILAAGGGIESIGRGQMEAARSLGMSYLQAMRTIILPQAVRRVLPPLGNDFVSMIKDSSLVSVLGCVTSRRKRRRPADDPRPRGSRAKGNVPGGRHGALPQRFIRGCPALLFSTKQEKS
jgi:Binding-protein-dependent transport system inner membrane component